MSRICSKCGFENIDEAKFCSSCGVTLDDSPIVNKHKDKNIPDGVAGWSWGAFLIAPIWAIGNKTWIGLLAVIPYLGFVVAIVLGFKGREWAWKNNDWDSLEHFNRVQRRWSLWGMVPYLILLGILAAVAIPKIEATKEDARIAQEAAAQDTVSYDSNQYSEPDEMYQNDNN